MTGLPIISADERLKETRGVKGVLLGTSGIGKTSQLWTLPPESTLFMDLGVRQGLLRPSAAAKRTAKEGEPNGRNG